MPDKNLLIVTSTPPTLPSDLERTTLSKILWRLLPFLFVLYIVAYLDRINVGFAALQMRTQLGFNDAVYGLGAGMFFAGYVAFQVPINVVLQRVGARRSISGLMIVWGIISACMLFVRTPTQFYAMRFLLGVAEAGFFPGVIFYMRGWFPSSVRARAIALFMTAAPLSGVVGGPLSGALLGIQKAGLAGWQWLFLIEALPAIILGVLVLLVLVDRPQFAPWLREEERSWLVATLARESPQQQPITVKGNPLAALKNPVVWMLAFAYFGTSTGSFGISLWLPTVLHKISAAGNLKIGFISAIPYLFAALCMVLVGIHSDRTQERRWHVAISGFTAAAAFAAAAYSDSLWLVVIALSLAMAGVSSLVGPFWAMPTALLSPVEAAAGIAFINSVGNCGGFLGPYVIGFVRNITGGFKGGFLAVGAAVCVSAIIALLLPKAPPK